MPFFDGLELKRIYGKAKASNYGFFANNVAEPNILMGLFDAYEEMNSDLVLQLSSSASKFAGGGDAEAGLRAMSHYIQDIAERKDIGVFLNLDHFKEKDMNLIKIAVDENLVSSIMIDASKESFAENVQITREVTHLTKYTNILVEAELGMIKGVEDKETASEEEFYTNPEEAVEFVEKTRIDLLAISVGTQHGVSKGKDLKLRVDLADEIGKTLRDAGYDIPLVLHGTSGLLEEQIKEMLETDICKMNKDTRYQYEYARAALDFYEKNQDAIEPPEGVEDDAEGFFSGSGWSPDKSRFDPRVVSREIRERIKETAKRLIQQAGSGGMSLYTGK